jgi:hypothetical protein
MAVVGVIIVRMDKIAKRKALLLIFLALAVSETSAQSSTCKTIADDKERLACYDAASKKSISNSPASKTISKPQETLTPDGKSCVLSASQKLTKLPGLQIIASRAKPTAAPAGEPAPFPGAKYLDVEIDAMAAGQRSTFVFFCITGPELTHTGSIGTR